MKLSDFVGNRPVVQRLVRAGLPQSSILAGPEGVGKRTLGLLLAARAQCLELAEDDACGRCRSCRRVAAGTHPDIFLIEPLVGRADAELPPGIESLGAIALDPPGRKDRRARIIAVEQIRELNREAQFRPFSGHKRFFFIDPAELMNDEAANSLLKTLEEPGPTTHIVLVTSNPDALLPTIRSRCQLFRFGLLRRSELAGYLERRTDLDEPELRAAFAGGSLGTALTLDLPRYLADRDRMLALLQAGLSGSFSAVFERLEEESTSELLKERERAGEALRQLEVLAVDLYYLNNGTPERALNQDIVDQLGGLSASVSLDQLRLLLHHIGEAQRDLQRFVRPLLCFETLWLDAAAGPQQPG